MLPGFSHGMLVPKMGRHVVLGTALGDLGGL
jgi:hypothetical protein